MFYYWFNNHFPVYYGSPYLNIPTIPIDDNFRPNKLACYTSDILGREIIHLKMSLNSFVVILYLEQPLIAFSIIVFIRDIFTLVLCPLLTKLRGSLWNIIFSFIKCFIVGSKHVGLETYVLISSSSEVDGDPNI